MASRARATLLAVCFLLVWASYAGAQERGGTSGGLSDPKVAGTRTLAVTRAAEPPVVDGSLNDSAWAQAEPVGGFIQRCTSASGFTIPILVPSSRAKRFAIMTFKTATPYG
jgi:hypothetical protein